MEVTQEEASVTPVKVAAVEVKTEAPTVPTAKAVVAEPVAAPEGVLKEVVTAVETEAKAVAAKAKRVAKNVETAVKADVEKTRVAITAEEHNVALRMENEFLKITTQITQLQQQAANIQKQFPEYIKSLATKYVVDVTKNTFNAIEGVFTKNQ